MSKQETETKKELKPYLKKCLIAAALLSVVGTFFMVMVLKTTTTTQYPDPTSYFYVEDYSGVFSAETESYIMEQAVALEEATKAQIVVVAVPDTQSTGLEDFSYNLANKWGIGDAELDNGVLLLFTTDTLHVRLEVGRGLEGCLNDSKSGRILDDWAVDAKDSRKWNEAAINTFTVVAQEIYEEYGLEAPASLSTVMSATEMIDEETMADAVFPEPIVAENTAPMPVQILTAFAVFWIIFFVPFVLICLVLYCGFGSSKSRSWSDDDYHGGGFSSGSSGGGFSGGGGSFGGGGASR